MIVQKRSFDILLVVSLVSPGNQRHAVPSNYASLNIVGELKRLPGIADVTIFGCRLLDARVDQPGEDGAPRRHAGGRRGSAARANAQYAAGRIGSSRRRRAEHRLYTVTAQGRLGSSRRWRDRQLVRARARPAC